MFKSSKSTISKKHDQLLNVINKIQSCYQLQHHNRHHQHYYDFNDLFYRCNKYNNNNNNNRNISNIKKQNKQQLRRNRRIKIIKKKTKIYKSHYNNNRVANVNFYQNSTYGVGSRCFCANYQNNFVNENYQNTITESVDILCNCAHFYRTTFDSVDGTSYCANIQNFKNCAANAHFCGNYQEPTNNIIKDYYIANYQKSINNERFCTNCSNVAKLRYCPKYRTTTKNSVIRCFCTNFKKFITTKNIVKYCKNHQKKVASRCYRKNYQNTSPGCLANMHCFANYHKYSSNQLNLQITNYLPSFWLNFQQNFRNFKLIIIIFLLALISMNTAAYSIDDAQGKILQNKTTSPSTLLAVSYNHAANLIPTTHFNESLHGFIKSHDVTNFVHASAVPSFKLKANIFHNRRHKRNHFHSYKRKILDNLKHFNHQFTQNKNSPKLLNNIDVQNPNSTQYDQNIGNALKMQKENEQNSELIENEIAKENENYSNVNKFLQRIHTNNQTQNTKNNNHKVINNTLKLKNNSPKRNSKDIITNKQIDVNMNVFDEDFDDDDNEGANVTNDHDTSLDLLTPARTTNITTEKPANHSVSSIHNQQHIDYIKLMELVMDGLGFKKLPNMKTVNISQKEYVTKYREYLQRVHIRKRRELRDTLGDYDENILRPLEIFSIVSNSTLPSQHHVHHKYFNEISFRREKRNTDNVENAGNNESIEMLDKSRNQSLEESVRNILFLKKKYQKPRSTKKQRDERKTNIRLMFALKPDVLNLSSSDIEEANVRLVLIHSPILAIRNSKNKRVHTKKPKSNSCGWGKNESPKNSHYVNVLNLKLYFISKAGKRVWLDSRKVDINVDLTKPDETHTQWLQFDVSKAVKTSIDDKHLQHVVLELQCDNCKRIGARILNDAYNTAADALADQPLAEGHQLMPVLNIVGHFDQSHGIMRPHKYDTEQGDTIEHATTQRHYHHQTADNSNIKNRYNRRTNCYKANQRCCRHSMEVTFKEIKGFEFIIQPKVFDAGYCRGRCPPRYNPAHHHAMLQSLIWKQNHQKAPRPCCAPSKLVELEVLHVDEKDSEKLKISTWSDMKVVECACS